MKLLQIGSINWAVLAVYDHRDNCLVMDELKRLGVSNHGAVRMWRDLRNIIPERGPDFRNTDKVLKLHGCDEIYELREQPRRGPKVRVLFFRDVENVIICTTAFEKRDKTPDTQIRVAETFKIAYFQAKRSGNIRVIKLKDSD